MVKRWHVLHVQVGRKRKSGMDDDGDVAMADAGQDSAKRRKRERRRARRGATDVDMENVEVGFRASYRSVNPPCNRLALPRDSA